MKKKRNFFILLMIIFLVGGGGVSAYIYESSIQSELKKEFSQEIFYTKEYYVRDEKSARKIIQLQGELLRESYPDNEIREVERYLEEAYKIEAVNLQGISMETANSIKKACDYMFSKYSILVGFVTNITVDDEISDSQDVIAKYENFTFIMNPDESELYPFVMKNQILLREREFGNPERLNNLIRRNIRNGFWPEGTTVESIVVHELAHALVDKLICDEYGLGNSIYITEENAESFSQCVTHDLATNQDYVKALCENAYQVYQEKYDSKSSYQEFCMQISEYAHGLQEDGGISYEETIAEALADYYLHEENCSIATKLILEQIDL